MSKPLISVVIPCASAGGYLKKCIDSICLQTYSDIEILCVCSKSLEKNIELIQEYKNLDSRIVLCMEDECDENLLKNKAISVASGQYITFVDQNDWLLLTLYKSFADTLSIIKKDVDVYLFNTSYYSETENDLCLPDFFRVTDWDNHSAQFSIHIFDDCNRPFADNLTINNKIYNLKFLKSNEIAFNNELKFSDMIFCFKSLLSAKSIVVNPDVLYRKRKLAINSLSADVFDIFRTVDLIEKEIYERKLYEDYKYALFQYKYDIFVKYYESCPVELREAYFNEMKYRLLSSETKDLDPEVLTNLRSYSVFEEIKNSSRISFDKRNL